MIFQSSAAHLALYFEKKSNTAFFFLQKMKKNLPIITITFKMAAFGTKNVHSAVGKNLKKSVL